MKTPLHTAGWGVGGFCRDSPPSTGKILTVLYLRATKDGLERTKNGSQLVVSCNSDGKSEEVSECRALCRAPKGLGLVGQSLVDPRTLSQLRNLYETLSIHISLFFPGPRSVVLILTSVRLSPVSLCSPYKARTHSSNTHAERWAQLKPNEEYARLVEPLLSLSEGRRTSSTTASASPLDPLFPQPCCRRPGQHASYV